jgi:hypothetical protein
MPFVDEKGRFTHNARSAKGHGKGSRVSPAPATIKYKVAEPVLTGIPRLPAGDRGIEWLTKYDGLMFRQSIDAGMGCETVSKYTATPITRGEMKKIPQHLTTAYMYPMRVAAEGLPSLRATESTTFNQRLFCPLARGFSMDFVDPYSDTFFSLVRPYTFEPCCCWPFFFCRPQNLSILDKVRAAVTPASCSLDAQAWLTPPHPLC